MRRDLAGVTRESPAYERDAHLRDAQGETRWVHWSGRGVFDGRGRLAEIQAVGRDAPAAPTKPIGAVPSGCTDLAPAVRVQKVTKNLARDSRRHRPGAHRAQAHLEALQRGRDSEALAARVGEALETTRQPSSVRKCR